MKKKVVALSLGLTLAFSVLTGCGNNANVATSESNIKEQTQTQQVSSEKTSETDEITVDHFAGTELDIAIIKKAAAKYDDPNDFLINKMAEEATGIHINWTVIDAEAAAEKISVLLASGNLPDAFMGLNETGLIDNTTIAQNSELFYDLSEEGLLETYAPNILADYETADALESVTWPDGSIYGLLGNQLSSGKRDWAAACMMINKEWLDKLGLPIPTTADEFYETLCAFRDNDMNGNGDTTDEIPLSFCNGYWKSDFMLLANPFGIGGNPNWLPENAYKQIKDGEVIPTLATDNFRAFLEFYHKLGKEGLLDLEGFSQTSDQWIAKVKEGSVGVTYDWEPAEGFVVMAPFEGIEGVTPIQTGLVNRTSASVNILTISADGNAEAVLHWWNYISSSTDLKRIARSGEEGIFWYKDNGIYRAVTPTPTDVTETSIGFGSNMAPALRDDETNQSLEPTVREQVVDQILEYIPTEGFSTRIPDPDKVAERALIEVELFDYIKSFIATSVVEGIDDAKWEEHLKQLEIVQYFEWIEWWQQFEDGEF